MSKLIDTAEMAENLRAKAIDVSIKTDTDFQNCGFKADRRFNQTSSM